MRRSSRPRIRGDMREVLRFTFVMGPLSSLFDVATFALLRLWFDAGVEVFRTAWFLESMATQIPVIFLICTVRPAWTSTSHLFLGATSPANLSSALLLTLTPFGAFLGFVPLPSMILLAIAALVVAYLAAAEFTKRLLRTPH